jgi:hypothetical protein
MKYEIILPIMIVFLVGMSSAGFLDEPVEVPSGTSLAVFGDYQPIPFMDDDYFYYQPVWIYPLPEGLPEYVHNNTSAYGMDDYYYHPLWLYPLPEGLPEWVYPKTDPKTSDDTASPAEPVLPLIMPTPLPISKDELFGSLTIISGEKQSLISLHKTGFF